MLEFDINRRGRPMNIEVIESEPPGAFDRVVIDALRRFRYEPVLEDGEPVVFENARNGFDFRIQR